MNSGASDPGPARQSETLIGIDWGITPATLGQREDVAFMNVVAELLHDRFYVQGAAHRVNGKRVILVQHFRVGGVDRRRMIACDRNNFATRAVLQDGRHLQRRLADGVQQNGKHHRVDARSTARPP